MRYVRATLKQDPLAWQRYKTAEAERGRKYYHRNKSEGTISWKERTATLKQDPLAWERFKATEAERSRKYYQRKKSERTISWKAKTANVLTHAEKEQRHTV